MASCPGCLWEAAGDGRGSRLLVVPDDEGWGIAAPLTPLVPEIRGEAAEQRRSSSEVPWQSEG